MPAPDRASFAVDPKGRLAYAVHRLGATDTRRNSRLLKNARISPFFNRLLKRERFMDIQEEETLSLFHSVIGRWFAERLGTPTEIQKRAWPLIAAGKHALITAPTGS